MKNKPIYQIIFDCDGVLLESTDIKTLAFEKVIAPFGAEAQKLFLEYHNAHCGISRVEKFKWFYSEILQEEVSIVKVEILSAQFSRIVKEEILTCPMVLGAFETLQAFHGKMPLYVCSGTPQDELIQILEHRKIAYYFTGIYGTPPEKKYLLSQIINKSSILAENTLMVGDAQTDLEAAEYAGAQFYGIGEYFKKGIPQALNLQSFSHWVKT